MKHHAIFQLIVLAILMPLTACGQQTTTRLLVVDEAGDPVDGATAGVVYYSLQPATKAGDHGRGLTGPDGIFSFTGRAYWLGQIGVEKEGFYGASRDLEVTEPGEDGYAKVKHEIDATLVLREIRNPVPMVAREVVIELPGVNAAYQFDLLQQDWLPPYGDGEVAHVEIKADLELTGELQFEAMISLHFTGEKDGLFLVKPIPGGSVFRWPYVAPEEGYMREVRFHQSRPQKEAPAGSFPALGNELWIVRFGSKLDEEGELVSAYYGRLDGNVELRGIFANPNRPWLALSGGLFYYHPEPNLTGMEFDTRRNLAEKEPSLPGKVRP